MKAKDAIENAVSSIEENYQTFQTDLEALFEKARKVRTLKQFQKIKKEILQLHMIFLPNNKHMCAYCVYANNKEEACYQCRFGHDNGFCVENDSSWWNDYYEALDTLRDVISGMIV